MFTNIPEKYLKYWADEIESVTVGTNDEINNEITAKELMSGNVHKNFAQYFFEHPITE